MTWTEHIASWFKREPDPLSLVLARLAEVEKKLAIVPKEPNADLEAIRGWNRMKLLEKFSLLDAKSKEIEAEWQKIQQDEHNATFAFQSGRSNEVDASYKKGVADGVKWCLNRFS